MILDAFKALKPRAEILSEHKKHMSCKESVVEANLENYRTFLQKDALFRSKSVWVELEMDGCHVSLCAHRGVRKANIFYYLEAGS